MLEPAAAAGWLHERRNSHLPRLRAAHDLAAHDQQGVRPELERIPVQAVRVLSDRAGQLHGAFAVRSEGDRLACLVYPVSICPSAHSVNDLSKEPKERAAGDTVGRCQPGRRSREAKAPSRSHLTCEVADLAREDGAAPGKAVTVNETGGSARSTPSGLFIVAFPPNVGNWPASLVGRPCMRLAHADGETVPSSGGRMGGAPTRCFAQVLALLPWR